MRERARPKRDWPTRARNCSASSISPAAAAAQAIDTIKLDSRKLLPLSKLNFQAAEADYRGGNGDFLKLITAQQQYLAAKLELARARADLYTQLASLDYQTSGAVWPASASATTLEATP